MARLGSFIAALLSLTFASAAAAQSASPDRPDWMTEPETPGEPEVVTGVLFESTFVPSDALSHRWLQWSDCSSVVPTIQHLKCEFEGDLERRGRPPRCLTAEMVQTSPRWNPDRWLVRRIIQEWAFIGANGARGCRLDRERPFYGLFSFEIEHQALHAPNGAFWWVTWNAIPIDEALLVRTKNRHTVYVCAGGNGVALPRRPYGYGHMGLYQSMLMVTEVRSAKPPPLSPEGISATETRRLCDRPSGS